MECRNRAGTKGLARFAAGIAYGALAEARGLGHSHVGTVHLLLALVRHREVVSWVEGAIRDGCLEIPATGAPVRVVGAPSLRRERIELRTCEPRVARTPDVMETNAVEVR